MELSTGPPRTLVLSGSANRQAGTRREPCPPRRSAHPAPAPIVVLVSPRPAGRHPSPGGKPARPAGGQGDGGLEDGPLEARWVSGVPGLSGMMTRLVLDWFAVPRARVHPCTTGPGSGGGQEKKASRCFPCLPPPIKKVPHGGMDGAALQRSKAFHSLRQSFHSSPHLLSSTAQRSAPSSSSSSILHASIHLLYPSIDSSHTIRTKSA